MTYTTRLRSTLEERYEDLGRKLSSVRLHSLCEPTESPWTGPQDRVIGRFETAELIDELVWHQIIGRYKELGYSNIELEVDTSCPGRSCITLWQGKERGENALLFDFSIWTEYLEPVACHGRKFRCLGVDWLMLQAPPDEDFARSGVKRLPGQRFVSPRLSSQMLKLLQNWAVRVGAETMMVVPEYFHSAVMFERGFTYLDPEMQGLYEAAVHQLLPEHELAELSWRFEDGNVSLRNKPFYWPNEAQVAPLCAALEVIFESEEYLETRALTRQSAQFAVENRSEG